MQYTVEACAISKSFGKERVLDRVDLQVASGRVVGLLGPNGAGKTTLVRILATLMRPDEGTAIVAGHDLSRDAAGVRRSISLTGQYAAVDDVLTGMENLEMMTRLCHLPRHAVSSRVRELLNEFDLADAADRRVATYSGGMRRRLDLAISMITHPRLLFLDEPTTGLDPRSRELLWGVVRGLVTGGMSVLLTTQYLEEADQLADEIVLLDHGRVIAAGTPEALKARVGDEVVRFIFGDASAYDIALASLDVADSDGGLRSIDVVTDGSAAAVSRLLALLAARGAPAHRVSTHRPRLDDVFLGLTGGDPLSTAQDAA